MQLNLDTGKYNVVIDSSNFDVNIGESARIDVGQAVTYIKSGEKEINDFADKKIEALDEKINIANNQYDAVITKGNEAVELLEQASELSKEAKTSSELAIEYSNSAFQSAESSSLSAQTSVDNANKSAQSEENALNYSNVSRIWAAGEDEEVNTIEQGEHSSRGYADLSMAIANTPEDVPIDESTLLALEVIKGEKGDKGDKGEKGDTPEPYDDTEIRALIDKVEETSEQAKAIAEGKATGYVFDTVDAMNTWIETNSNILKLGDNLYIRAVNVPDYWWDGEKAQQLETQKVDLTNYVKNTDYAQGGVAGVVKASGTFACGATNGYIQTTYLPTLERYNNLSQYGFIGKGTLETVLTQYSKTVPITQADYDALATKDANTLYLIEE